ncbi:uncharacterized protein M6B38_271420 [Iris pallida]|uniref:Uncharacterized protein n=1 Tax=Iris pallida TaxID=29817 RepID=A0AAX6I7S2_IRIPA|nr:uncharacterized protein M6B38_287515 [Iris pallida]KAJ6849088.1 uncharacterized protein M6B38_271420 [Iris pallida]
MATNSDLRLRKVGKEAFDILEEYLGTKGRKKPQNYCIRQVPNDPPSRRNAGEVVVAVIVDGNQVARGHGGAVMIPRPHKPTRWAF